MDTFGRSWLYSSLLNVALLAVALGAGESFAASANIIPTTFSSAPPTQFDRSFSAALHALRDEGVVEVTADRGAGFITGHAGSTTISVTFRTQADGTLNVQFASPDPTAKDLLQRIFKAYNRGMGR